MLGSPPKPPRLWPEPPPAHTHGIDRFLYPLEGDREPRLAHVHRPDTYPFTEVEEEVISSNYAHSLSAQVRHIIKEESTKVATKEICPCKPITVWSGKELKDGGCSRTTPRCPVKTEPSTPCQVPEVTTSSKTDISGNNNGGIPVGIAIARQRVQQNAPSPLVLTCQDRSPQVPTWPVAPPHWQFTPSANTLDQGVPIQQLVVRDPVTGQLMLLQSQGLDGGMPRAVVWPGNAPMQLMQAPPPQPQPVLLSDRLVTIAPQVPDKRRIHDPVSGVMFPCEVTKNAAGQGGSGLLIQPTLTPQQFSSVLIQQMPFPAHHNNALLLSTQVAEHSLINQNLVISNHLENTVINPQIIGMENPNFGPQSGLMQHMHPSLVISHHHTETNFMRQDITPVLPLESPIIVKQEIKTESSEPSPKIEDLKYEEEMQVQDASNQTETEPKVKDETPVEIKSEKEEEKTVTPDLSGLELLSNSIAEHEKFQASPEPEKSPPEKSKSPEPKKEKHFGGLGFLCEVAANHGFFNAIAEDPHRRPSSPSQPLNLSPNRERSPVSVKDEKVLTPHNDEIKEKPEISPIPPPVISPETKPLTEPKLLPIKKIAVAKLINSEQISPETSESLKKRPGRPKKLIKFDDDMSGEDSKKEEPPVLEPWSALPKQKSTPLPPTLTPHKKRKSFESIEENDSFNYPPPLSPPSLIKAPHKKKLLKLLQKQMSEEMSHANIETPNRIRPKLKAEAKVKVYNDDDELEEMAPIVKETPLPLWKVETKKEKTSEKKKEKPKLEVTENITPEPTKPCSIVPDCTLSEEHLVKLPCNILMAQEGLFYTGQVTESKAEGIFEVILERERHRKPHILCSEEITNNAVLEVKSDGYDLPTGTRLCAYWSQQYNCLYPGRASSRCEKDVRFVNVEFDDGDHGKINRDDIRLLPADYPMVECDPNPLSSLGKRKRLSSTTSADTSSKSLELPVESPAKDEKVKPPKKKKKRADKERPEKMDEGDKNFPSIISSIVEDFFQSEHERKRIKKEKKRLVLEGRAHKHRHRDACKSHHKRKHKHHRKHKHKHSIDKEIEAIKEEEKEEPVVSEPEEETEELPPLNSPKNSKSKIAAFLPERHEMWVWKGDGVKRGRSLGPRGKGKKTFYKSIQRGNDVISVGDCAVFVSTGRPDRPFIGKIESLWATTKNSMAVKVSWFYHPEEAIGAPEKLNYPGGLFESPHNDCNDVQTISHKCEVVPLSEFLQKVSEDPNFLDDVYENQEIYYLAGHYDPHNENITFEPGVHQ